jgi:ornithine decarboxylase
MDSFQHAQRQLLEQIASSALHEASLEPFYVIDLGDVVRKHAKWVAALPRVKPFYACKCNGEASILDTLVALGTGFDCASMAEMKAMVERGVAPERMIYAHPCKPVPHLAYAKKVGVKRMTFDNADELRKIAAVYPEAELVLRVLVDDQYSVCRFGTKFGAPPPGVPALMATAAALGLAVVGVSFHVGSGCKDARGFTAAIEVARGVFTAGWAAGHAMRLLDVGGGFPGSANAPIAFEEIARVLGGAIDVHFPADAPEFAGLEIIAEPGRYMVASAASLAVNITSKRTQASGAVDYYVNDGVYGSFNCILFDHQTVTPNVLLTKGGPAARVPEATCIWGPTCDSMDCITKEAVLPELEVGDWLYFKDMGAYTMAASSTFNGFPRAMTYYLVSSPVASPVASSDSETEDVATDEPAMFRDSTLAALAGVEYDDIIEKFAAYPNFTHMAVPVC